MSLHYTKTVVSRSDNTWQIEFAYYGGYTVAVARAFKRKIYTVNIVDYAENNSSDTFTVVITVWYRYVRSFLFTELRSMQERRQPCDLLLR